MRASSLKITGKDSAIIVCVDTKNNKNTKNIKIFNIKDNEISTTVNIVAHNGIITSTCISDDLSVIISGSEDNTIKGWDIVNGELLFTLLGHNKWVYTLDISNDNGYIASGSGDNKIFLWGIFRKVLIRKIKVHSSLITCVKFNKNSSEIVSSSCDFTICLSNTKTGKLIKRFLGHTYIISNVNFSDDDSKIISTSLDGTVRLWDKNTGIIINKFEIMDDICRSSIISPSNNLIISFGNRKIYIWCVKTCKILKIFECHDTKTDLVSFSMDGKSFCSVGIDEENNILEFFKQNIPIDIV